MEFQQENNSLFELNIDSTTATQLNTTGKWARFLAIATWVILGVVFLFLAFFSTVLIGLLEKFGAGYGQSDKLVTLMAGGFKVVLLVVFAIIFGLVALYTGLIYKFGNNLLNATKYQDQTALEKAFSSYKTYLIITGILGCIAAFFVLISLFL